MHRVHLLPLITFLSLAPLAFADITSAQAGATTTDDGANPMPAASGAATSVGGLGYDYVGCYNETTGYANAGGRRALSEGGSMNDNVTQTVEACMTFCRGNGYTYCGLEYGRECWGAPYLSILSTRLDQSNCSIGCAGNSSEICGGRLTMSLYNASAKASSSGGSGGGGDAKKGDGVKEMAGAFGAAVLAGLLGVAFSAF